MIQRKSKTLGKIPNLLKILVIITASLIIWLSFRTFFQGNKTNHKSFILNTHSLHAITLTNPSTYLKAGENNDKYWYYVHFENDDYRDKLKTIKLRSVDLILKNTFVLFLSYEQLNEIAEFSLVKRIEPNDKFAEEAGSIEKVSLLLVQIAPEFELPSNPSYSIESKFNDLGYVVRIDKELLSDDQYTKKKKEVVDLLSQLPAVKSISTYKPPKILH